MKKTTRKKTASGIPPEGPALSKPVGPAPGYSFYRKATLHLLIILLTGLAAYSNTFHSAFVFDDTGQITDNPMIKNLENFELALKGHDFNTDEGHIYVPSRFIGYLSIALNYRFGGLDVTGYHIVNLAIHIITSLLVYFLVVLTFRTPKMEELRPPGNSPDFPEAGISSPRMIALFSSLLFVSHPIQTEAVTYVIQRFASLAAMFYVLSLVMYIKARLEFSNAKSTSMLYGLCSLLFAILAMKTKETSFTLPFMIVLYEFTFFKLPPGKKLLFLSPFLLTIAVIPLSILGANRPLSAILSDVLKKTRLETAMPRWDYLMTQMRVITTYIRLIFLPTGQNLDYDYPLYHSLFTPPVFFSFLFLLSLFGTAVYLLRLTGRGEIAKGQKESRGSDHRHLTAGMSGDLPFMRSCLRLTAFGILWFFISLSVESSIIPIVDVIFEHRVYLPSVGAFVAIASALVLFITKIKARRAKAGTACAAALALVVFVLSGTTYARNGVWKNAVALWENTAAQSPRKARPLVNLAIAYIDTNKFDKAEALLRRAIDLDPSGLEDNFCTLASLYLKKKDFETARAYSLKALSVNPESGMGYSHLCTAYVELHKYDEAFTSCGQAARIRPHAYEVMNNLSMIYRKLGRREQALEAAERAVAENPDSALVYNNLGLAYVEIRKFEHAEDAFKKSLSMDPNYAEAYNNLGGVYMVRGNYTSAKEAFANALRADPNYIRSHFNLGVVYSLEGNQPAVMGEYEALRTLSPSEAERFLSAINRRL